MFQFEVSQQYTVIFCCDMRQGTKIFNIKDKGNFLIQKRATHTFSDCKAMPLLSCTTQAHIPILFKYSTVQNLFFLSPFSSSLSLVGEARMEKDSIISLSPLYTLGDDLDSFSLLFALQSYFFLLTLLL